MTREYELTVIFAPILKEEGLKAATTVVANLAKKLGGKVVGMEVEGKEALAYPIKKFEEGIYVFWRMELPSEKTEKFEADLKLQKGVIRQLLVRV